MINNSKRKNLAMLLFPIIMYLLFLVAQDIPATPNPNTITIYHTNDMHGSLDSRYNSDGQLTQIGVDVIKTLKDSTPNCILIDAGDATQGGRLASSSQGSKIIELMNAAGYDLATLGNHEFDYGLDALKANSMIAKFKIISANVYNKDNKPLLQTESNNGCNSIIEINGKKLGFFGITTCGTKYSTLPKNVEDIIFKNEIETAKQQCNYLKEQNVDAIILIAHVGVVDHEITTDMIAKEVPEIDVIIDGHSHSVYSKSIGKTFIQQIGTKSQNIGKIELDFDKSNKFNLNYSIIKAENLINPLKPDMRQYSPDFNLTSLCETMMQNASAAFRIIIGKSESGLYGGDYKKTSICRLHDTNLGNLIADSLIHHRKELLAKSGIAQNPIIVSLQNGGGIRTSLSSSFISQGDLENTFPFPNKVVTKLVTPKQLYAVMETGLKSIYINSDGILSSPDGAFPNVSGMRIEFDINGDPMQFNEEKTEITNIGSRVKKIVLLNDDNTDKYELDRNDNETQISLVTNSFEASGGDQYLLLKDLPSLPEDGLLIRDAFGNYIKYLTFKNGGSFYYPSNMCRVTLTNSDQFFAPYNVNISIIENSMELKNTYVAIQIDQDKPFNACTDENGNITLENIAEGPHNIKVSKAGRSIHSYINNRIGITSADIFLENNSDVDDIINLINSISSQKISDINEYVSFARNSYDSLSDSDKTLVSNYDTLLNAEKANLALNPSTSSPENKISNIYTIITIIIIILLAYAIIYTVKYKATQDRSKK